MSMSQLKSGLTQQYVFVDTVLHIDQLINLMQEVGGRWQLADSILDDIAKLGKRFFWWCDGLMLVPWLNVGDEMAFV